MRVKLYDKDWSEQEVESEREIVIETPLEQVRIYLDQLSGRLSIVGTLRG